MGREKKWIVVPGGPGMSNNYLKYALPKAFPNYKLHFYDLLGAPESEKQDVTIDEMVDQLETEANFYGENGGFGLITHSFGNYLAFRLLEKGHKNLKSIIMLNPAPFKFNEWKQALNNIIKKVPDDILNKIGELSKSSSRGIELFNLIYPFYVGNKSDILPIDVPFNAIACNAIAAQVREFDDIKLIQNYSDVFMIRVVGSLDPFYTDPNVMKKRTLVLKEVGHYPFFEDPNQFNTAMLELEKISCQTTMPVIELS